MASVITYGELRRDGEESAQGDCDVALRRDEKTEGMPLLHMAGRSKRRYMHRPHPQSHTKSAPTLLHYLCPASFSSLQSKLMDLSFSSYCFL